MCRLCAVSVLLLVTLAQAAEPPFRMPTYPRQSPPAARPRAEVEALLAGAKTPDDTRPLRVLLVAGAKDHGQGEHDYPAWQKVWNPLLSRAAGTTVSDAWEFPTDEQADEADVMVFYQHGDWDDDRTRVIDKFLARGGGLVYIHFAVDGRSNQAEFAQRIGLASRGGTIGYRHGLLNVDFSPGADHPIARNFSRIDFVDESYWRLTGDPGGLTLIASVVEEGEPRPLFWTVERGRGRVFVSVPGHYTWTFDDPAFRVLLLRGIAWSARSDVDRFNELVTLDARIAE